MKDLQGKVAVITGAASGIGRATACALARAGATVHLADIRFEPLAAAQQAVIRAAPAARPTAHTVDCADAAAVQRLADAVFEADGRVDILHNNAGVCLGGPVEQLTPADWQWILGVNLYGVIHGLCAFVPRMIAQGRGGHIVNTASMAGLVGLPYVAAYCASKFAVVGLSESLDAELAHHGIRVAAICPGAVRTELLRNARLALPGRTGEAIARAFDAFSADPDRVARRVLRVVRRGEGGVQIVAAGEMLPLWWLKRTSTRLYDGVTRELTRLAVAGTKRASDRT